MTPPVDRVRMAAAARIRFEQRHLRRRAECACRRKSGDARADDRHAPHASTVQQVTVDGSARR
jgi:hypothetical protein